MEDQTEKIMQLNPVNFRYIDNDEQMQYGLIAEEAAKQYPEFIAYDKDGQIYSFNYMALIPILLKQIQQLENENQNLKIEFDELRSLISFLAVELEKIKKYKVL